ncbi:MAG: hypothetical protein NTV21_06985 [Planctomycetota bacterium]|nr:hypothetical protein [Planctomycetota bacterium]
MSLRASRVPSGASVGAGPRAAWRGVLAVALVLLGVGVARAQDDDKVVRVFVFAGQSNMVGADSRAADIAKFPPFAGLDEPQERVRFSYCIGREEKRESKGWEELQPVEGMVGPELCFARDVARQVKAPIAIIKIAAGGTHLAGDWNPDEPRGFKLYPLALQWVRDALSELDKRKVRYRLEGFMWHQGENDMFEDGAMEKYAANLERFIACWRRDLGVPQLRFYVGELCTKTIWGMDLRPSMYKISVAQHAVADADPLVDYVPTSHVGVEIGGDGGLHYHYGTLGQLEHGANYATAYLRSIGKEPAHERPLKTWPYAPKSKVTLYVLAGHRNMEGERAFVQDLEKGKQSALRRDNADVAYRYSLGGGYRVSNGWEPLGPTGLYDTFGPELSFGAKLAGKKVANVAIAKWTHSGTQIVDWTPQGSEAVTRNVYPQFIEFVRAATADLRERGHEVELGGILYHLGENDMSFGPFRQQAVAWLESFVTQSRKDLGLPELDWYVSQQRPTDEKSVNGIDVTGELAKLAARDPHLIHLKLFDLPGQEEQLVLTTAGIVALGEALGDAVLKRR